ncbi:MULTISPECIES: hypothetical protein [unclassified Mucilaginibacter]|uniref:hypothetical protein n=1 Tax=unclassified Mucilaginibacter TaxID=2617802 RepID=UPI002AC91A32|nr:MULTISPECIES: hypothetical protein [unclassified Mucilaginibacter]MEB0263670.1 hypothetical protein [Mucilaginibacter sp. 10I4]MEB0277015.1 hypothetical protein [Mucilaginibacter sp. 10B2]MEB0302611.1 hypothetical protein [Mucilaginibacter sp. 5C4]WPX25115.1 hypothetical protein RHM67_07530 [Mucilaginibacter sp. 5C4]
MPTNYQDVFDDSFDTFKVFDNLKLNETGQYLDSPKSIWQILNHLIKWQGYQLAQLQNMEIDIAIDEDATWIESNNAESQDALNGLVKVFAGQMNTIKTVIEHLNEIEPFLYQKLKIVQDLSVHLSFHVGEVILMRRMAGNYPLPHQMKDFLT